MDFELADIILGHMYVIAGVVFVGFLGTAAWLAGVVGALLIAIGLGILAAAFVRYRWTTLKETIIFTWEVADAERRRRD